MEMIDIYDAERNLTGTRLPRKTKLERNQFMLYVLALVQDPEGRFLVTRRALDKKWAAGSWEIPGGGALAGETSLDAVCREVREETGLNISGSEPEVVCSYRNEDAESGDNYFADIYLCRLNFQLEDVTIQKSEVTEVKLADAAEIRNLQEKDGFLHFERVMKILEPNS